MIGQGLQNLRPYNNLLLRTLVASLKADKGVMNQQVALGGEHCLLYSFICEISRTHETWLIILELFHLINIKQVKGGQQLISRTRMELIQKFS